MSRAIQLAKRGEYTTRPNPNVGCIIVANNQVAGEGFHYRAGEAHAEVNALRAAGDAAKGATAYVTLEPCNHQGRTGPCTQALADGGIARVVYGMTDPNPLVSGQGLAALARSNIIVDGPLMEAQCQTLNLGFISRMKRQRPWVRCKMAISIDGRTAMPDTVSSNTTIPNTTTPKTNMPNDSNRWVTGCAARADVQKWRARSSAVITGIESVLQDNSRLNLRKRELSIPNADDVINAPPLRVVLDSHLRIPVDAAVFNHSSLTIVITTDKAYAHNLNKVAVLRDKYQHSALVTVMHENTLGQIDLQGVLSYLAQQHQCNAVLVEAGAVLAGAFLQEGLIDELILYQAPIIMGSNAKPLFHWIAQSMTDKRQLSIIDRRQFGQDQRIIARFADSLAAVAK